MPRLGGDDGGSGGFSRALQKPVDAVTDMFWGIVNFGTFFVTHFFFENLTQTYILVVIFFSTMLNLDPPQALSQTGGRTTGRGGGGGGGPGRGFKGMNDIK